MLKTKIQVVPVTEPPAIGKPQMMSGIRSKEAAQSWAAKNGYPTVYWFQKRERVYADKLSRIDTTALTIQQKSQDLLQLSENGGACLTFMLMLAFVLALVFLLKDIPW